MRLPGAKKFCRNITETGLLVLPKEYRAEKRIVRQSCQKYLHCGSQATSCRDTPQEVYTGVGQVTFPKSTIHRTERSVRSLVWAQAAYSIHPTDETHGSTRSVAIPLSGRPPTTFRTRSNVVCQTPSNMIQNIIEAGLVARGVSQMLKTDKYVGQAPNQFGSMSE